jgi:hypothetical protein
LARNIVEGISELIVKFGELIVLEDDLVTAPHFLSFMNEGLTCYRDEAGVISLSAYVYPVACTLPETFFIRGADCWGWATWKRGWDLFESDGGKLLAELKGRKLCRTFDFNGSFGYTRMLRAQIAGRTDSWAIRWYASAFLNNKLTLYPGCSLIRNIGNDGTGVHSVLSDNYESAVSSSPIRIEAIPIEENGQARVAFERFFRSLSPWLIRPLLIAARAW